LSYLESRHDTTNEGIAKLTESLGDDPFDWIYKSVEILAAAYREQQRELAAALEGWKMSGEQTERARLKLDETSNLLLGQIKSLQKSISTETEVSNDIGARLEEARQQRDTLAEASLRLADIAEQNTDDVDLWESAISEVRTLCALKGDQP